MNDNMPSEGQDKVVKREARQWLARLQHDTSPETREEFERWLAASPDHRPAFEWISRVFSGADVLKTSTKFGRPSSSRSTRRWLWAGGAAAAAAVVALAVLGANGASFKVLDRGAEIASRSAEPMVTRRGEIRRFRLADGSTATLDTDSRIEVSITENERRLSLSQGRARFEVAADPRPFTVRAGAGEVLAHKAVFDVAYESGGHVQVELISGDASVRPAPQFAVYTVPPSDLTPSGTFGYRASDYGSAARIPETSAPPRQDWTNGWVEYRSIRLDRLIEQANRYADIPIKVDDAATGGLMVSGRFRISATDNFVARIAELFDLTVNRRADGIYLRKR